MKRLTGPLRRLDPESVAAFIADLVVTAIVVCVVAALVRDDFDAPWFAIAATGLAAAWVVTVAIPAAARELRERAAHRALPDLSEMALAQLADPLSGIWLLTRPCGHPTWWLYGPGQGDPVAEYPLQDVVPASTYPADHGAGLEGPDDRPQTLEQIRRWAVPWIELVSDRQVVELVEGLGLPYGPGGLLREVEIFARVQRIPSNTTSARSTPDVPA